MGQREPRVLVCGSVCGARRGHGRRRGAQHDHANKRGQGGTFIEVAKGAVPRLRAHRSACCSPSRARLPPPTTPRSTRARFSRSASISASSPLPSARRSRACAPRNVRARPQHRRRWKPIAIAQSESTLETVLAAEPQALLIVGESGEPELLVANLPVGLGVPREANALLDFESWLDAPSASALDLALRTLVDKGEAFNLMLSTLRDRFVEVDGRVAGHTIVLKVRDLFGRRLELAELAAKHRQLEDQVASLRALLDTQASMAERAQPEPKPSVEARFRSFDRLATAFAVFDQNQRLTHFNQAYVELWQLDPEWLGNHPRDGEILDRLRQERRLPEKADYRDWKRTWLSSYGSNAQVEDLWHLPDGRTLHVIADSEGGRGDLSLRERHRADRAREPLQRADPGATRDARHAARRCRRVRPERPPQALQSGLRRALALEPARSSTRSRISRRSSRNAAPFTMRPKSGSGPRQRSPRSSPSGGPMRARSTVRTAAYSPAPRCRCPMAARCSPITTSRMRSASSGR